MGQRIRHMTQILQSPTTGSLFLNNTRGACWDLCVCLGGGVWSVSVVLNPADSLPQFLSIDPQMMSHPADWTPYVSVLLMSDSFN